jgi:hypothetical protein
MTYHIGTPWGTFSSFIQLERRLGKEDMARKMRRIFSHLDAVPRRPMLDFFGLENPSKLTWEGLGFTRIPK